MRARAIAEGERWLAQAAADLRWVDHPAGEVYTRDAARDAVAFAQETVTFVQELIAQMKAD